MASVARVACDVVYVGVGTGSWKLSRDQRAGWQDDNMTTSTKTHQIGTYLFLDRIKQIKIISSSITLLSQPIHHQLQSITRFRVPTWKDWCIVRIVGTSSSTPTPITHYTFITYAQKYLKSMVPNSNTIIASNLQSLTKTLIIQNRCVPMGGRN